MMCKTMHSSRVQLSTSARYFNNKSSPKKAVCRSDKISAFISFHSLCFDTVGWVTGHLAHEN